jgi:N6-L-threonylcarbamoyladenine synthase
MGKSTIILAIESSCDDTGIAILRDRKVVSNLVATQEIHKQYGGVVPELASRAHQQNLIPALEEGLRRANISIQDIDAIAFARGPGLIGSLMVGVNFAKGLSLSLGKPLIEVNHIHAHVLAHLIEEDGVENPVFPFLCLTVSGGHTQLMIARTDDDLEIIGQTMDDAAGEAFDKAAKILGLPYPGGPLIDKFGQKGNPNAFEFPIPQITGYNFSFSGLKTSMLYFIRDQMKSEPDFIQKNLADICSSYQKTIIKFLLQKLIKASKELNISNLAISGGVSANSLLRKEFELVGKKENCKTFIPQFEYCTDNAAMIGIAAYFKFHKKDFSDLNVTPSARID